MEKGVALMQKNFSQGGADGNIKIGYNLWPTLLSQKEED